MPLPVIPPQQCIGLIVVAEALLLRVETERTAKLNSVVRKDEPVPGTGSFGTVRAV